ncbi:GNAT family N-acetyltransferase [Rhodanobacter sp. Col0626]|uniref:GNAT family N-acetyltransferase n=1 Tax=Rhodanobacter sp. Col0626 TaxID=3415679 RepID=UPI003CEE6E58
MRRREWVNERYAEVGFVSSDAQDFIAIAEVDGQRAAIGRIVTFSAFEGELGGMYVLSRFRGHGLANLIIDFLVQRCELTNLYCLPFAHLPALYAKHGFVEIEDRASAPQRIREKFEWCQTQYPDPVRLMELVRTFKHAHGVPAPGKEIKL